MGYSPWGPKESDMTEHACMEHNIYHFNHLKAYSSVALITFSMLCKHRLYFLLFSC